MQRHVLYIASFSVSGIDPPMMYILYLIAASKSSLAEGDAPKSSLSSGLYW